jgi:ATP-dependent Lhr-like helicase
MSKSQAEQAVDAWFAGRGWKVFPFQRAVWKAAVAGQSGLLHANTGAGKTYAVWFAAMLRGANRSRRDRTGLRVLWITPMRALAADTQRSLEVSAAELGAASPDAIGVWTLGARTGDTGSSERARQAKSLPGALITTPESLSLLLSHAGARDQFKHLDMIIIDEWHELMGSKRGVQVQLALARLRRWNPELVVWGLSATMGNLQDARNVLLGTDADESKSAQGVIVEGDLKKQIVVDCLIPQSVSRFPWGGHLGLQMLQPVIEEIEKNGATLVFTNTRASSEIWYQNLIEARPTGPARSRCTMARSTARCAIG